MNDVMIRIFRSLPGGERKRVHSTVCDEGLAHDELRDLLHMQGVEHPERAIEEGGPVYDGGTNYQISWEIVPLDCQGHPAGPYDPMGQTVYCDGSCIT